MMCDSVTKKIEKSVRNKKIDFLKGVAAILVVLGHVIQYGHKNYNTNVVYNIIYSFHMPLFMFLSGWVMVNVLKKEYKLKDFFKRKFMQLMIPFFTWAVIGSAYHSLPAVLHLDFKEFFYSLRGYIIKPEHGLWYCWVLFFICLFHFIVKDIGKTRGGGCSVSTNFLGVLSDSIAGLFRFIQLGENVSVLCYGVLY